VRGVRGGADRGAVVGAKAMVFWKCFKALRGPGVWGGLLVLWLFGCAAGPDFQRSRPVELSPLDVITWRPYHPYAYRRLCLMPFSGPKGMEKVGMPLADVYRQELLQNGLFSAPTVLEKRARFPGPAFEDPTDLGNCSLVLAGTIERIHDGSGALPTVVELTVRIVDAEHGTVLWEVIQKGRSLPSPDVDLFWNVISGGGAADYRETGRWMARQFAFFLKGEDNSAAGRDAPWMVGGIGYGREDR